MNDTKPIWLRKPKEVSDEDYNNFYKSFSKVSRTDIIVVRGRKFSYYHLALLDYIRSLEYILK